MRKALLVLGSLMLTACSFPGSLDQALHARSQRGAAPPANLFELADLKSKSIKVEIPAGEWRLLRLDARGFIPSGEVVAVGVAYEASLGAYPWVGVASQIIDLKMGAPIGAADFLIAGVPDVTSGASGFYSTWSAADPSQFGAEFVYLLGTKNGPATFYIGVVDVPPPPTPLDYTPMQLLFGGVEQPGLAEELRRQLLPRPLLQASLESGRGGFGAWYYRRHDANGQLVIEKGGPYEHADTEGLPAIDGLTVDHALNFETREQTEDRGVFSYSLIAYPQFAANRFSYAARAANHEHQEAGLYAGGLGASGSVPACSVARAEPCVPEDGVYFRPLYAQGSFPVEPGPVTFQLSHTSTGRYGGSVAGQAGTAGSVIYPGLYLFHWGYIAADFEQLYGWNVEPKQ